MDKVRAAGNRGQHGGDEAFMRIEARLLFSLRALILTMKVSFRIDIWCVILPTVKKKPPNAIEPSAVQPFITASFIDESTSPRLNPARDSTDPTGLSSPFNPLLFPTCFRHA